MSTPNVRPFRRPSDRRLRRGWIGLLTALVAIGLAAAELPESPDSLPAVAEAEPSDPR